MFLFVHSPFSGYTQYFSYTFNRCGYNHVPCFKHHHESMLINFTDLSFDSWQGNGYLSSMLTRGPLGLCMNCQMSLWHTLRMKKYHLQLNGSQSEMLVLPDPARHSIHHHINIKTSGVVQLWLRPSADNQATWIRLPNLTPHLKVCRFG